MIEQLLTARVVAEQVGVTADTVRRWTLEGKLPAVKLPSGQIRYRPSELAEWIERQAVGRA